MVKLVQDASVAELAYQDKSGTTAAHVMALHGCQRPLEQFVRRWKKEEALQAAFQPKRALCTFRSTPGRSRAS